MKGIVEIFSQLGEVLKAIPEGVIAQAEAENEWFCQIGTAIEAIRYQMLDGAKIEQWLSAYPTMSHAPKRVAIVMAGNIPAVGFADLMYTIASGNIPVVKYSTKDRVLMEQYDGGRVDAAIATGSDSATLHFKAMFGDIPTLIRGSRHSVAVLTGDESREQLEALSRDIFTYSGLGCRNVSLVFAPEGYDFTLTVPDMPAGYRSNYRHARALMTLQGTAFKDHNGALTVEGPAAFSRHISCVSIARYSSLMEVEQWLTDNDSRLQCVVSGKKLHPRTVDFGMAQYPRLNDYADDVDVMKFLLTLH